MVMVGLKTMKKSFEEFEKNSEINIRKNFNNNLENYDGKLEECHDLAQLAKNNEKRN